MNGRGLGDDNVGGMGARHGLARGEDNHACNNRVVESSIHGLKEGIVNFDWSSVGSGKENVDPTLDAQLGFLCSQGFVQPQGASKHHHSRAPALKREVVNHRPVTRSMSSHQRVFIDIDNFVDASCLRLPFPGA